jgi:hypothetical protein
MEVLAFQWFHNLLKIFCLFLNTNTIATSIMGIIVIFEKNGTRRWMKLINDWLPVEKDAPPIITNITYIMPIVAKMKIGEMVNRIILKILLAILFFI